MVILQSLLLINADCYKHGILYFLFLRLHVLHPLFNFFLPDSLLDHTEQANSAKLVYANNMRVPPCLISKSAGSCCYLHQVTLSTLRLC